MFVATLVAVTDAPCTTPPLGSMTVPVNVARIVCAMVGVMPPAMTSAMIESVSARGNTTAAARVTLITSSISERTHSQVHEPSPPRSNQNRCSFRYPSEWLRTCAVAAQQISGARSTRDRMRCSRRPNEAQHRSRRRPGRARRLVSVRPDGPGARAAAGAQRHTGRVRVRRRSVERAASRRRSAAADDRCRRGVEPVVLARRESDRVHRTVRRQHRRVRRCRRRAACRSG